MKRTCEHCGRRYSNESGWTDESICPDCREELAGALVRPSGLRPNDPEEHPDRPWVGLLPLRGPSRARRQQAAGGDDPVALRLAIAGETRTWGIALLVLGGIHQIANGILDPGWGVLLIAVGLASLYFRSVAMLVIYGMTMAWAMISNGLSGQVGWTGFAALQAYFTFRIFRQFVLLRRAELRLSSASGVPRAEPEIASSEAISFPAMPSGEPDGVSVDSPAAGPAPFDRAAGVFPRACYS